jgi:hypothetical protein
MNGVYINPQVSLVVTVLLILNLLLVSLAWYNLKEIRRSINKFLSGESADKIAIALERDKLAGEVRREFMEHKHGPDGKVLP